MARKQRVVGSKPSKDVDEVGRIDVQDIETDELGNEIESEEQEAPKVNISKGIIVHYSEPTFTLRSGREVLRGGGKQYRVFAPETHGKNYAKLAEAFIASCQINDGQRRPKFLSKEEV